MATFGTNTSNTSAFGLNGAGMLGTLLTMPATGGLVQKVRAATQGVVENGVSQVRCAIYSASGTSIGTLLGTSLPVTVVSESTSGQLEFTFTTPINITGGQTFWAVIQYNAGRISFIRNTTVSTRLRFMLTSYGANPPNTWTGTLQSDAGLALLVTYQVPVTNTSPPVLSGDLTVGSTVSVTNGSWSPTQSSFNYAFIFQNTADPQLATSFGQIITDQASITIPTEIEDLMAGGAMMPTAGLYITAAVEPVGGFASATSNTIGPITAGSVAPVATTPPSISGTPALGQTLTAIPAVWNLGGSPLVSNGLEWLIDGVVSGRTGPSFYVGHPEMLLSEITVRETVTTNGGTTASTSAPVTVSTAVHQVFHGALAASPSTAAGWTNSDRVKSLDGSSATFTNTYSPSEFASFPLTLGFDLSAWDLPAGCAVEGIEVRIVRSASAANAVRDNSILLTIPGAASSELAQVGNWPTASTEIVYGGPTDLLGFDPLDLVSGDGLYFSLVMSAMTAANATANLDSVSLTLFYEMPVLNGEGWPTNIVPPTLVGTPEIGQSVTVTSVGEYDPEPLPIWYYKWLYLDGSNPNTAEIVGFDYGPSGPTYEVPTTAIAYPDGGVEVPTAGLYLVAALINHEQPAEEASLSNVIGPVFNAVQNAIAQAGATQVLSVVGYVGSVKAQAKATASAVQNLSLSGHAGIARAGAKASAAAKAALSITGYAGSVKAGARASAGSTQVLSLSGLAGSVKASAQAPAGATTSVALTGLQGVVKASAKATASLTQNLVITGYQGSASTAGNVKATAGPAQNLTIIGLQGSVRADAKATADPMQGLSITGHQGSASAGVSTTAQAGATSISINGFAGAVRAGARAVGQDAHVITVTGHAGGVKADARAMIPANDEITITGHPGLVRADAKATAGPTQDLTITGHQGSASTAGNVKAQAGPTQSLALTGHQGSVAADVRVMSAANDEITVVGLPGIVRADVRVIGGPIQVLLLTGYPGDVRISTGRPTLTKSKTYTVPRDQSVHRVGRDVAIFKAA